LVFTGSRISYHGPPDDIGEVSLNKTSRLAKSGDVRPSWCAAAALAALLLSCIGADVSGAKPAGAIAGNYRSWTLEEAVGVLTDSPWARKETYTRLIGGIGSGLSGEKEIYSTFFVRFLSASPIREAYARVSQIQSGYDQMSREEQKRFDSSIESGLKLDVRQWIVVTLSFRSNDQSLEHRVKQFLETQTTETMESRAFLSTARVPQLQIAAYYPPREEVVGARFVFPRRLNDRPAVAPSDDKVTFELDLPGFDPELRVVFPTAAMKVEGRFAL
jgi:hypothetical protein